ncbi:MAG: NDP-sugar synthase [Clostridia bacterium]|nr:NDP-sugar synthase [Clostridia bacterium]
MKALFLSGARDSKLSLLTDNLPKSMLPIMGKPLLERLLSGIKHAGIKEVVIATGPKANEIKSHFDNGGRFGLNVSYLAQDLPLGSGGYIKKAGEMSPDTYLVLNSYFLTEIDFKRLIQYHRDMDADVTVVGLWSEDTTGCDVIEYTPTGMVKSICRQPTVAGASPYINAGIYVVNPSVISKMPDKKILSFEEDVIPRLVENNFNVALYKSGHYFIDINSIENYIKVHRDMLSGLYKIPGLTISQDLIIKGVNSKIHPDARITGPVYIGNNVEIGPDAFIGPDTVIGNKVRINMGSRVIGSIIWDNVMIERDSRVINTIVTSHARVDKRFKFKNVIFTGHDLKDIAI